MGREGWRVAGLTVPGGPAAAGASSSAVDVSARGVSGTGPARPLTERILARLPGSRLLWVLVWAALPWLNLATVLVAEDRGWSTGTDHAVETVNRMAVSFAIVLSLWGAARISAGLRQLRPELTAAVEEDVEDVDQSFRGLDSTTVPLLLTVAVGLLLPVDEVVNADPVAAAIQGVTWLLIGLPMCTAVWVYTTLQRGLHRLGQGRLTLREYVGDRTLGLRTVGSLAFTGFWMFLGSLTPIALTGSDDLPSVLVTSVVLVAGVALFFLSLRGLHRQMSAIKQRELQRARQLYEQAYTPVRQEPTLARLDAQSGSLNAAESLEKRAERIQAWPFDEGTFARVVTIATSAVATILARILLAPTGL